MIENIVRHHRKGRKASEGRAQWRPRDRLHGHIADDVADRRLHSASVHDRPRRTHVPRVRADADHRCRRFGHRVADIDADDVRSAPARQTEAESGAVSGAFDWGIDGVVELATGRTLELVLRHQPATLFVALPDARRSRSGSTLSCPKASCPIRIPARSPPWWKAEPQVSFTEMSRVQKHVADAVNDGPRRLRRRRS